MTVAPPVGMEHRALAPGGTLRVLIVEDNVEYAELLEGLLAETWSARLVVEHVSRVSEARRVLNTGDFDCILLDLSLPDAQGLGSVGHVRQVAPELPIVVLTGFDDEATAVNAMKEGAQDYLVKARADGHTITRSIRYAVERKRSELELERPATSDPLTGLPNRMLFMDRLGQALARGRRRDQLLAVMFLDLDGFKTINDSLGHDIGDRVLVDVAMRLAATLRPADTLARFGGDEFLVLCEELESPQGVDSILERFEAVLDEGCDVDGRRLPLTASIGVALSDDADADAVELVRNADTAMYEAKGATGFSHRVFEHEMLTAVRGRLDIQSELLRAIDRGEFVLHYQPQVDLRTGALLGLEALVRWRHPERGLLLPEAFIAHAERTGGIAALGAWVLEEACAQLARWTAEHAGAAQLSIGVNVAGAQLATGTLPAAAAVAFGRTQVDPERVVLELTERSYVEASGAGLESVRGLAALGCGIAVDDFGTGYAALSMLADFPVRTLKIDRVFVHEVELHPRRRDLLGGIVELARCMGIHLDAEGIETSAQLDTMRDLGFREGQGFLFATPLAPEAVGALLASGSPLLPRPQGTP
jgi:diguanylate cyclase (GGDEF)-like protein